MVLYQNGIFYNIAISIAKAVAFNLFASFFVSILYCFLFSYCWTYCCSHNSWKSDNFRERAIKYNSWKIENYRESKQKNNREKSNNITIAILDIEWLDSPKIISYFGSTNNIFADLQLVLIISKYFLHYICQKMCTLFCHLHLWFNSSLFLLSIFF